MLGQRRRLPLCLESSSLVGPTTNGTSCRAPKPSRTPHRKSPNPPEGVEAFPVGGPGTRHTLLEWTARSQRNAEVRTVREAGKQHQQQVGKQAEEMSFKWACFWRNVSWDSSGIPSGFRRIPRDSTWVQTDSGVFHGVKRQGFTAFSPGGILHYIILKNNYPSEMTPATSPRGARGRLPGAVQMCFKILQMRSG